MTVPYSCDDCGDARATIGEQIVHGRLHWSVSHSCAGTIVEECGRDELPPGWRAALLARAGTYRLTIDRAAARAAAMRVLRRRGVPLTDLAGTLTAGLSGTETEMHLAALDFAAGGVPTTVSGPFAAEGASTVSGPRTT